MTTAVYSNTEDRQWNSPLFSQAVLYKSEIHFILHNACYY